MERVLSLTRYEQKDYVFHSEISSANFYQILYFFEIEGVTFDEVCDILEDKIPDRPLIYYFNKEPLQTSVKRFFTEELRSKA